MLNRIAIGVASTPAVSYGGRAKEKGAFGLLSTSIGLLSCHVSLWPLARSHNHLVQRKSRNSRQACSFDFTRDG